MVLVLPETLCRGWKYTRWSLTTSSPRSRTSGVSCVAAPHHTSRSLQGARGSNAEVSLMPVPGPHPPFQCTSLHPCCPVPASTCSNTHPHPQRGHTLDPVLDPTPTQHQATHSNTGKASHLKSTSRLESKAAASSRLRTRASSAAVRSGLLGVRAMRSSSHDALSSGASGE